MADHPFVYIFYGDDEIAMREAVAGLQSKLGDPATADLNTTRMETEFSIDDLRAAAHAIPFAAERRIVIARDANKTFTSGSPRTRFTQFLDELPKSAALVLLETGASDEKHWGDNWLTKWAKGAGARAFTKSFFLPHGNEMTNWIMARAKSLGGEIQPQAAAKLGELTGSDKNAAEQEIQKLLALVAFRRPVEIKDVKAVSLPIGEQGDFFGLVDALSAGYSSVAMQELEMLLQERDLILLYFSLVGHFRGLLLCRALLDQGMAESQIAAVLAKEPYKMHPFRAQKLTVQARRFSIESLEAIYKRLLYYDEHIKIGQLEPALAIENLVAELSVQAA